MLILLLFIPIILNKYIFDNAYATNVSNDGWASFLGSYIGGAIGGIGTLVAMYITIKQTQKQIFDSENKNIQNERRKEANEIVDLVATFLSDISVYYDAKERHEKRKNEIEKMNFEFEELLRIWEQFRNNHEMGYSNYLYYLDENEINTDYAVKFFKERNNKHFEENRMAIYKEYEENLHTKIAECKKATENIDASIKEIREKRVLGCQSFWILEIKLSHIQEGQELWNLILELYKNTDNDCMNGTIQNNSASPKHIIQQIKEHTSSFSILYCKN